MPAPTPIKVTLLAVTCVVMTAWLVLLQTPEPAPPVAGAIIEQDETPAPAFAALDGEIEQVDAARHEQRTAIHAPAVAASVRGCVVDERGVPLPGTSVFHNYRPGQSSASFDRGVDFESLRDGHVRTDSAGRFAFEHLLPGRHYLLVESPDHLDRKLSVELVAAARHDFGTVMLTRGRRVRGRVFDEFGARVAGAVVEASSGSVRASRLYGVWPTRRGAITGEDGSFELRGLPPHASVRVAAPGFVPHAESVPTAAPPLVITLRRALSLAGCVAGTRGKVTTVALKADCKGEARLPPRYTNYPAAHEVRGDGTFRVDGLGPGGYLAQATTAGVGNSRWLPFELPRKGPLQLEIVPAVTLDVLVVDDRGVPIEGATVVCDPTPGWSGLAQRIRRERAAHRDSETDAAGRAQLRIGCDAPLALAADHAEHLPAAVVASADAIAGPIRVTLQRAGWLRGRLSDATRRSQFHLGVVAWPAGAKLDAAQFSAGAHLLPVDAQGRFHSRRLLPGRYRLAVERRNMTWQDDPARRLPDARPLLGEGIDPRMQVGADVVAGEHTEVAIETPPLGELRGTVFAGNTPAAGVAVWAVAPGKVRLWGGAPRASDRDDAYEFEPFARTDAQGRFSLLFASTAGWQLYARHPGAAYPTGPLRVPAPRPGSVVVRDIQLHSAVVRGRYDVSAVADEDRDWFVAYLFRVENAGSDPFFSPHHGLSESTGMREEPVGTTGEFAFRFLPPGVWVLRVVSRGDRVEYWRVVETGAGQAVDLGQVVPPRRVDAAVSCDDPRVSGVWLRQAAAGTGDGLFVARVLVAGGVIALPSVPAGRYTLEPFALRSSYPRGAGKSLGVAVPLVIGDDGATEPNRLVIERW